MAIEYTLICDECARVIDGSTSSPAVVRRVAKQAKMVFRHEGRELCKWCFADLRKSA